MAQEQTNSLPLDDEVVISYLRNNEDFFLRNKALLTELNLPHASGQTISLVEHQVAILRERNMDMRRQTNELLQTARENDQLFSKTRSLTLSLLDTQSPQELNEVLATHLLVDFEADFVCCHMRGSDHSLDHIHTHTEQLPLPHLLSSGTAICTSLRADELKIIFPFGNHESEKEAGAEQHGSAVLLPLKLAVTEATLCIGSLDGKRFSSDMDTLFVEYIADVLAKTLNRVY